jgi:probable rRNA maturation factor
MPATVVNIQRKIKLDIDSFTNFAEALFTSIGEAKDRSTAIAFISDRRMEELNKFFRGKNSKTDVLSFPHEPDEFDTDPANLGDIVISAEQAARQADEDGLSLENEIKQLILHGLLHLCCYDHETDNCEMNTRELEIRDKLGI